MKGTAMPHDIEIFLFIDALGWELAERTGFLRDLLPFRRPVVMQFGYSCSAIPTILSGKTPAEHGHLSLFRFAPADSPFRKLGGLERLLRPKSFWNRGRVRHHLSRFIAKLYGFSGYFQLYQIPFDKLAMMDFCEKKDLFAPRGMDEIENLHDLLIRSELPFHISNWRSGDRRNFAAACRAVRQGKRFLFLYTAELDALLHSHIDCEPLIRDKLEFYRKQIQQLLQCCRRHGKNPSLTVISDHGMTPLEQIIDLKTAVERTRLVFGRDYGACYDSTLFRVTFLTLEAEPVIRRAVKPFEACGRWLSEEEEKRWGIHRGDRFFGDALFLTLPGIQIEMQS